MSRHNTPGTIKIGNTVVQTGGGAYTPGGVTSVTQQRRILKTKEEVWGIIPLTLIQLYLKS